MVKIKGVQWNAYQACPARDIPVAIGLGCPAELNDDEMGPALKLASHIMISLVAEPPAEVEVNMSKATSATTVPDDVCSQSQVL